MHHDDERRRRRRRRSSPPPARSCSIGYSSTTECQCHEESRGGVSEEAEMETELQT